MKSIFLVLSACGALAAEECQIADEATLLQGGLRGRTVKKHMDANSVLKSLQHVASSMAEGSGVTMSRDDVDTALSNAHDALAGLSPTIRAQVEQAQQQINDAAAAVQVCHQSASQREFLQSQMDQHAASLDQCEAEHAGLVAAAEQQCGIAQDCLCDEANARRDDKAEVCAARRDVWEIAFCEFNVVCTEHGECHAGEMNVYNALRADVESEMQTITTEYTTVEQSTCLMGLIMAAMTGGQPMTLEAQSACLIVDTSALTITYPEVPEQPAACPQADVQCEPVTASPLTDAIITSSTQTGWGRSPNHIRFGDANGLVGHNWNALEVTFEFPSTTTVTGVETDYATNPYSAFVSMDGQTWEQVLNAVSGDQSLPSPTGARFARLRWEATQGTNGIRAQFLGASSGAAPEPSAEPTPLTATTLTSSTPTGWGRSPVHIQWGDANGLVGHNWWALEVTYEFASVLQLTGVRTDYSGNPYRAFASMDGQSWQEVVQGSGDQTFSPTQARFGRLRWEDTHGTSGIHAQFLGTA